MFKVFCCLGVAAAMLVGMYVGPGVATVGDLSSWGGLATCNGKAITTITCPDCSATYAKIEYGKTILFILYEEPKQCKATGCTQTFPAVVTNTDCTPPPP